MSATCAWSRAAEASAPPRTKEGQMPIVWVHGVAVRQDPPYPPETETYLREIVAPAISGDPGNVEIIAANWFEHASTFAWNLSCIPGERSSGITGTGLLGGELA